MKKEFKPEYIRFNLFTIQCGCFGGSVCEVAKHLVLEELRGKLTEKELKELRGGDYGERRKNRKSSR